MKEDSFLFDKELITEFLSESKCRACGEIRYYIANSVSRLCKRCERKRETPLKIFKNRIYK